MKLTRPQCGRQQLLRRRDDEDDEDADDVGTYVDDQNDDVHKDDGVDDGDDGDDMPPRVATTGPVIFSPNADAGYEGSNIF